MTTPTPALDTEHLFRVERGVPTEEETAALAVVLLMRLSGAPSATEEPVPAPADWRSPDRAHGHRAPRSWRTAARRPEPGTGESG
ncbi:acyl-CoA carboxylase subunit epsilon [Streptomyces sp. ISL-96]|uniref:acyl-CoA carboxylase subunit epsilon n=1 Tax=Streptomyces sp. ISL-96 TaxID=2819191 RepID=UPI001BE699C4|nr:acyl-CoA carboxylase subunit epsilon [Streptomyces sp. ISL-96]MBT2488548.1 acyl-CoA carboxylase subunit epsilon [Streptomyces sp. ISL-96]